MVKGKTMTPVPEGIISTSTGPAEPTESVVEEAIEEELEETNED
jgi:hypothetical protein